MFKISPIILYYFTVIVKIFKNFVGCTQILVKFYTDFIS